MKKSLVILVLLLTTIMLTNRCKNVGTNDAASVAEEHVPVVVHLPKTGEKTLNVSVFADTVVYIPLETTAESFIGHIEQLWMNDSLILISDLNQGLLLFDRDGAFIRKIGKNGRGPGEYLSIFAFDVLGDTVYVSSTGRSGFLKYGFDGSFLGEIKLDYQPVYFGFTVDQRFVDYDYENGKIYNYNNGFDQPDTIVVEYVVAEGRRWYMQKNFLQYYIQKTSSGILFNGYLSDTIWNIAENGKEPTFILDTDEELLPYDKQIGFYNGNFDSFDMNANAYNLFHLMPVGSLFFVFQTHYSIYDAVYDAFYIGDSKTGEIRRYDTSFMFDDLVGKQKLVNERLSSFYPLYSDEYLVTSISAFKVIKNLDEIRETGGEVPTDQWTNQMKNIKENDNPVIVKIKIKEDL